MKWTRPAVKEITLGMEVTSYVNTDDRDVPDDRRPTRAEQPATPEDDRSEVRA